MLAEQTAAGAPGDRRPREAQGASTSDWIEINRLENDGDRLYRTAVAELFDGGMETCDIIKWKDIYTTLEGAMDQCEDIANILESIVLKNT